MERKAILEVKSAKGRQVHAMIATLNRRDVDGDTVKSGFFSSTPMESLIVPAHNWTHVPLGKALTWEHHGVEVRSILEFNGTPEAASWFEAIEHDFTHGRKPLQQYSWGFKPHEDAQTRTKAGRDYMPDGAQGARHYSLRSRPVWSPVARDHDHGD